MHRPIFIGLRNNKIMLKPWGQLLISRNSFVRTNCSSMPPLHYTPFLGRRILSLPRTGCSILGMSSCILHPFSWIWWLRNPRPPPHLPPLYHPIIDALRYVIVNPPLRRHDVDACLHRISAAGRWRILRPYSRLSILHTSAQVKEDILAMHPTLWRLPLWGKTSWNVVRKHQTGMVSETDQTRLTLLWGGDD